MENGWVGTGMQIQIIISLLTVLGAGVSVYVAVRVALAEMKRDIQALEDAQIAFQKMTERGHDALDRRLMRIEDNAFRSGK